MVMALSLLAVSCNKDEGGSKTTSPTPTKLEVAVETVEEVAIAAEAAVDLIKQDANEQIATQVETLATEVEAAKEAVVAASTDGKITDATAKQKISTAAEKITTAAQ